MDKDNGLVNFSKLSSFVIGLRKCKKVFYNLCCVMSFYSCLDIEFFRMPANRTVTD